MAPKLKAKKPAIEPEVVGDVSEVEEFDSTVETTPVNPTFTVKLDTKKLDNRDYQQVVSLVQGALGGVKKIVIEIE
jgi:hypothetical protein